MITVDQTDWNKYEIFRRMLSGSDMEGDGAWFWLSQPDFSDEDLRLIRFEWSTPQKGWQECIPVDGEIGDIFPGHNWAKGTAGAYRVIWAFVEKEMYEGIRYRAIVPKRLLAE